MALDSTALVGSVALCDNEHLLAECTLNTGNTHSETLLPTVEFVLKSCGVTVDDIDLFACTIGPGSFTGVRIGTATVKGIAFGKDKPCVGVSTLEALATNAKAFDGIICPCMNARREQVYNALFESKGGKLTRLCEDRALAIEDLLRELEGYVSEHKIYLVGDGAELVIDYDEFGEQFPVLDDSLILLEERLRNQSGYSVACVALDMYRNGISCTDAELAPVYLRPSQAERMRLENEKKADGANV
ncbi:MAG: tRNA (adenosine(37)-N6)-threonylcarbamoyltransferase complex dimerization subunit type 1 TsaB [Ruminococcaceae bacterium]|nr:tRNA (adenosine(37)-N6)-threonylcarbamoyltransferase complex dimerization subunit type 1 TsaB [Oscillospiraceae bacterium]